MDKIAVLVPCYNEALTVQKVVSDWKTALPEATVYVYDNNSADGTAEIAEKAGAEYATTDMLTEAVAVLPRESVTFTVYVIVPLE